MSEDIDKERRELYFALRSRVLTDEEMAKVAEMDFSITIPIHWHSENSYSSDGYNENDKRREFCDALLQQFKLRAANSLTPTE